MSEREPIKKTDWSMVDKRIKDRAQEENPTPAPEANNVLSDGLKELEIHHSQAMQEIEKQKKTMMDEYHRLQGILKTRPLTNDERENFKRLI